MVARKSLAGGGRGSRRQAKRFLMESNLFKYIWRHSWREQLVILGVVLSSMRITFGTTIAIVGLALFGLVVVFQLVNLPVEFNASSRAREILVNQGMVTVEEDRVVAKVLNAAAMTYVAATITAIATLLYYASIVFGQSRRD